MSKQGIFGAIIVLTWLILGIFNIITGRDVMIGLIGFMMGVYLYWWENKDVKEVAR